MELITQIKPKIYQNTHKGKVMFDMIYNTGLSHSSYSHICNVLMDFHYTRVLLYNLVKHNKKRIRKNGKWKTIEPPCWTAYTYEIPMNVLMDMKVEVIQHPRYFEIHKLKE